VIERDSVALWWYNRARRPRVELTSFGAECRLTIRPLKGSLGMLREAWLATHASQMIFPPAP